VENQQHRSGTGHETNLHLAPAANGSASASGSSSRTDVRDVLVDEVPGQSAPGRSPTRGNVQHGPSVRSQGEAALPGSTAPSSTRNVTTPTPAGSSRRSATWNTTASWYSRRTATSSPICCAMPRRST
jgi:hypothetical protein